MRALPAILPPESFSPSFPHLTRECFSQLPRSRSVSCRRISGQVSTRFQGFGDCPLKTASPATPAQIHRNLKNIHLKGFPSFPSNAERGDGEGEARPLLNFSSLFGLKLDTLGSTDSNDLCCNLTYLAANPQGARGQAKRGSTRNKPGFNPDSTRNKPGLNGFDPTQPD